MKNKYLPTTTRYADGRRAAAPARRAVGAWGLCLLGLLGTSGVQAQQRPAPSFFRDDAAAVQAAGRSPLAAALRQARPLTLDAAGLRAALAAAPREGRPGATPLAFTLPLPNGTNGHFRIVESPVMEAGLAARYPDIKTYSGVSTDDPTATIRLDLTPRGFHAQVLGGSSGTLYIDPVSASDPQHCLSFYRRDMLTTPLSCGVSEPATSAAAARTLAGAGPAQRTTGTLLRTFRLAVAATGEYTATQGGTVPLAMAGIVSTVNRVVGVYEKELAVRLVLVSNNDQLVYTDGTTDPYTNNNGSTMLGQNQTNVTAIIGTANFDIGHVFSTGGGGVASLGVVCSATSKARGVTGLTNPVGDAFAIDYVAHEIGHQFRGNHTFNSPSSNCSGGNRSATHAYEIGSGSTIMAYAGICTPDNLQPNSDAYFHVESYEEIQAFLALGTTTCAVSTATANTLPNVTVPASGAVLPIGTPFKLTAVGTDADGDALTYCWEEYDRGASALLTAAQVAGQTNPLFRSFSPTTSPTRYFPRLTDLLANTSTTTEQLPSVTRPLNFRVTVRDAHNGAEGIVGGLNSSPAVVLSTTSAAGPFLVTAPNTAVTWAGASLQAVTWDVAGTDANGVNCALVNLRLSTDGGLTYPTLLLANVPNNGSASIVVPNVATTTARLMVEAADNYFFDISNANFSITATAPSDLTIWTGALSADWFAAGNWSNGLPSATLDALVPAAAPRYPLLSAGAATARTLTLATGGSLAQAGGTLALAGNFVNNGTYLATGGALQLVGSTVQSLGGSSTSRYRELQVGPAGAVLSGAAEVQQGLLLAGNLTTDGNALTLLSGASGTAYVVNDTGVVLGAATVQRYLDPSLNPGPGYRHYSAPVSGSTVADLATSGFTPTLTTAYNTSATPGSVAPFPTVFGYEEARLATATNNLTAFDKGFFVPAASGTALSVGRGYIVNIGASQLVDFVGPLNNGTLTMPLARNPGPTAADAGWQLLGNPYPAPLDYSLVAPADRANLDASIYVFGSTSQYGGQYRTYVNGVGGNPILPVAQGFFVRVSSGQTSGSLTFRNSQRLTAPNATAMQRTTAETRPLLQLTLQGAGSITDDAYVYFEQGATAGFDSQYDAVKLPNSTGLNLSTTAAGLEMAINGLPLNGPTAVTVPLTVYGPASGTYTLHAAQVLNFGPGAQPFLHDLQLNTLLDLSQQPTYTFTLNATSTAPRFELVFGPQQVLSAASAGLSAQVALFPNPARTAVTLELPAALRRQPATATLVDALGRVVHTQMLPAGLPLHVLPLAGVASGVYSVRLQTPAGLVVKKLVVE